jgi:hypothetical protein
MQSQPRIPADRNTEPRSYRGRPFSYSLGEIPTPRKTSEREVGGPIFIWKAH